MRWQLHLILAQIWHRDSMPSSKDIPAEHIGCTVTLMFVASIFIAVSLSSNAFLQFSKQSQTMHSLSQDVHIEAQLTQMNLCLSSVAEKNRSQFGAPFQFNIDALRVVFNRFLKVEFVIALECHFQSLISLFLHRRSSNLQDHKCSESHCSP